jgi:hypothetical protein
MTCPSSSESERIERLLVSYQTRLSNWAFLCLFACLLSLAAAIRSCGQMAAVDRDMLKVAQLLEQTVYIVTEGKR